MVQFQKCAFLFFRRHPEGPRFRQRAEGYSLSTPLYAGSVCKKTFHHWRFDVDDSGIRIQELGFITGDSSTVEERRFSAA